MKQREPLEPDRSGMEELSRAVLDRCLRFVESLPDRPASLTGADPAMTAALIELMLQPPPEHGGDLEALLARLDQAADHAVETAGPGYLAYIPGGGVLASAVAQLYAKVTNRYVGLSAFAPGLAALEHSVVQWFCRVCGLPPGATGQLVSGGSMANFSAVVAARHTGLGEQIADGTFYVTAHTHHSVVKAARLAGIPSANVREVPCTADLRMDVATAAELISADRAAGRRPFLVVGSAGTTDTGTIDPLADLAALAEREGLWFHVDGAYGGMFRLTGRGRQRLRGLEDADSVTLDPHKSLFLPYGTGALVTREASRLGRAHAVAAHYLQDLGGQAGLPDFADLGLELTREARGLGVWFPLHLYGVGAFRDALDEKLDLAQMAYERLGEVPALEVPWRPDLTVIAFRVRAGRSIDETGADEAGRRLLERVNATRRVFISSTVVDGRFTLRLCILSHRTHAGRVEEALGIIAAAAREIGVA